MGGILLNAAVGAMLWRPVEMMTVRRRAHSSTAKALPVPSLSAAAATANEQSATPLIQEAAFRDEAEANAILPEVRICSLYSLYVVHLAQSKATKGHSRDLVGQSSIFVKIAIVKILRNGALF